MRRARFYSRTLAGVCALEENTPLDQAAGITDLDKVFPMLQKHANLMLAILLSATACIAVSAAEREDVRKVINL
jgi:hypothetical protein